jgi:hypothetical protein
MPSKREIWNSAVSAQDGLAFGACLIVEVPIQPQLSVEAAFCH